MKATRNSKSKRPPLPAKTVFEFWKTFFLSHSVWNELEMDGGPQTHRRPGLSQPKVRALKAKLKKLDLSEDEIGATEFELLMHDHRDKHNRRTIAPEVAQLILIGFRMLEQTNEQNGNQLMRDFFSKEGEFQKWEEKILEQKRSKKLNEPQSGVLTSTRGSTLESWRGQFKEYLTYNLTNDKISKRRAGIIKEIETQSKDLLSQLAQSASE